MAALGQINTLKCGATDTLNPTADMVEKHTHTHTPHYKQIPSAESTTIKGLYPSILMI